MLSSLRGIARQRVTPVVSAAAIRNTASDSYAARFPTLPQDDTTTPQFTVGLGNGFLPRHLPLEELPSRFKELEQLLQRIPNRDGKKGLLARGEYGKTVEKELPQYDVTGIEDSRLLSALFRDYTFASNSYLLEPCDLKYQKEKRYGPGRDRLPKNLAVPLTELAKALNMRPYLEYATGYALMNYKLKDKSGEMDIDNMDAIRHFTGSESENGFILTHVAMVRYTPDQVTHTLNALDAVKAQDREAFNKALSGVNTALDKINSTLDVMWRVSRPDQYNSFRTFIMGTKDQQEMFPNGVVYEGVSEEPQFYRGETGAHDSIIPTLDNLLELTAEMPENDLTRALREFRSYRPKRHTEFLTVIEEGAKELGVRKFACEDAKSSMLYMLCLDQNRDFRNRHWSLTKEYILKYSEHPRATGGTPIITWLPNQLNAVLKAMEEVGTHALENTSGNSETQKVVQELLNRAKSQRRILEREVDTLKSRRSKEASE